MNSLKVNMPTKYFVVNFEKMDESDDNFETRIKAFKSSIEDIRLGFDKSQVNNSCRREVKVKNEEMLIEERELGELKRVSISYKDLKSDKMISNSGNKYRLANKQPSNKNLPAITENGSSSGVAISLDFGSNNINEKQEEDNPVKVTKKSTIPLKTLKSNTTSNEIVERNDRHKIELKKESKEASEESFLRSKLIEKENEINTLKNNINELNVTLTAYKGQVEDLFAIIKDLQKKNSEYVKKITESELQREIDESSQAKKSAQNLRYSTVTNKSTGDQLNEDLKKQLKENLYLNDDNDYKTLYSNNDHLIKNINNLIDNNDGNESLLAKLVKIVNAAKANKPKDELIKKITKLKANLLDEEYPEEPEGSKNIKVLWAWVKSLVQLKSKSHILTTEDCGEGYLQTESLFGYSEQKDYKEFCEKIIKEHNLHNFKEMADFIENLLVKNNKYNQKVERIKDLLDTGR